MMPLDKPKNPQDSNVELSDLEQGDTIVVEWVRTSNNELGKFISTVQRTSQFGGGTTVTLESGKIYGDYYPPIVETPQGNEYRLETINYSE